MFFKKCLIVAFLFLTACSSGGSSDDPGEGSSSLRLKQQSFTTVADGSGAANFSFNIPQGSSSFQVATNGATLKSLVGPQGNLLAQAATLSSSQLGSTANLNYYSSNNVSAGNYTASYSAEAGSSVTLQVFSKADSDLSSGTLKLNIVLLGPVAGSEDTMDALDKALEAERITFSRAGISLDTQISNFDGPNIAPVPGDILYQNIVSAQRADSITVVIASQRRGAKSDQFQYGTIGTTPFPVIANANSVIVIAVQDITGGDGIFDLGGSSDEKRILGEEIGRFAARAMGLDNIVTLKGDKATGSDDIPDSPSCLTTQSCRDDAGVRTNLMYPEPLRKLRDDVGSGTGKDFYPRDQLTGQQGQVLNNSVFVD